MIRNLILVAAMLAVLAGAAFAQSGNAKSGTLEFTVSVPFGGIGTAVTCDMVGIAAHVRCTTTASTIRMYGEVEERYSSGAVSGNTIRKPYGEAGKRPTNLEIFWTIFPSTLQVWNEYRDIYVDTLVIYNTAGAGSEDVTVQVILE